MRNWHTGFVWLNGKKLLAFGSVCSLWRRQFWGFIGSWKVKGSIQGKNRVLRAIMDIFFNVQTQNRVRVTILSKFWWFKLWVVCSSLFLLILINKSELQTILLNFLKFGFKIVCCMLFWQIFSIQINNGVLRMSSIKFFDFTPIMVCGNRFWTNFLIENKNGYSRTIMCDFWEFKFGIVFCPPF